MICHNFALRGTKVSAASYAMPLRLRLCQSPKPHLLPPPHTALLTIDAVHVDPGVAMWVLLGFLIVFRAGTWFALWWRARPKVMAPRKDTRSALERSQTLPRNLSELMQDIRVSHTTVEAPFLVDAVPGLDLSEPLGVDEVGVDEEDPVVRGTPDDFEAVGSGAAALASSVSASHFQLNMMLLRQPTTSAQNFKVTTPLDPEIEMFDL
jgi:hypothetical protein